MELFTFFPACLDLAASQLDVASSVGVLAFNIPPNLQNTEVSEDGQSVFRWSAQGVRAADDKYWWIAYNSFWRMTDDGDTKVPGITRCAIQTQD